MAVNVGSSKVGGLGREPFLLGTVCLYSSRLSTVVHDSVPLSPLSQVAQLVLIGRAVGLQAVSGVMAGATETNFVQEIWVSHPCLLGDLGQG